MTYQILLPELYMYVYVY